MIAFIILIHEYFIRRETKLRVRFSLNLAHGIQCLDQKFQNRISGVSGFGNLVCHHRTMSEPRMRGINVVFKKNVILMGLHVVLSVYV